MAAKKDVCLRAFRIGNASLTEDEVGFLNGLVERLENSCVRERQMPISDADPNCEYDIISNYCVQDKRSMDRNLCATLMRVLPNGVDEHIENSYLEENTFRIEDISRTPINGAALYKNHFYLCMNNQYLITAMLPRNFTITRVQTYINWLLGVSTFELVPFVTAPQDSRLSDLKEVVFSDPFCEQPDMFTERVHLTDTLKDFCLKLFRDVNSLQNMDINQIISAEMILKVTKPRDMSEDDYQNRYGAILKPVADLGNIYLKDKKGNVIRGDKIQKTKNVSIDTTSSGYISEQQLNTEMARFIRELPR